MTHNVEDVVLEMRALGGRLVRDEVSVEAIAVLHNLFETSDDALDEGLAERAMRTDQLIHCTGHLAGRQTCAHTR
ncbi:hypothetical protein Ciccas_000897 [Cichlidogyrus casuarinus]|uniref:Uncharacterized protein n=1 Tax=Cichlidogyrus casuarinus TaxID=1844966 RepID=A0ABD2QLK8_9PLAT